MMNFRTVFAATAMMLTCICANAQNIFNPDGTVTFRYRNDNASAVQVDVQFAGRHDMTRGGDGLWSVTLGPAEADIYPYCFVVDGVSVMDPLCDGYFPNETFKNSLLSIPSRDGSLRHDILDVPHGAVDYVTYKSATLGIFANAIVYTPASYHSHPERSYPVMYLISGTTDTEEVYFKVGKMNLILDNLVAKGLAKEMIIVLPYGNPSLLLPAGTNPFMMGDMFGKDLVNDLIPFVETNYRTINDRDHRAIGGFSRGGNQGLAIGLTNLDKFSWLCSYSSFTSMQLPGGVYDDPDALNERIHLFWLGVGTDDFLYGNAKEYMDFLDSKGIDNIKEFTTGKFGHTWMNARYFLDRTFRLLFSDKPVAYPAKTDIQAAEQKPSVSEKPDEQQRLTPEVMARLFPRPLVSPDFSQPGAVTFRFRAADAKKVELIGEIVSEPTLMERDSEGVWSISINGREGLFRYAFRVDGTDVADPCNMYLSPDKGFKYSLVDVKGAQPSLYQVTDVPHGKVSYRIYNGKYVCIYTPAGYDPEEKLPVIFLSYGEGDSYESWFKTGKANVIMDNLIAGKLAPRSIVVMSSDPSVRRFVRKNYRISRKSTCTFAEGSTSWIENRNLLTGLFQTEQ